MERFNEKYDGTYFADIEFIPRNDSGGGYSDKINASVMSGDLPDVITVDGPNISAYAANGIIQPLAELSEEEKSAYLDSILDQGTIDGKLYALGAMESSVGLYYNKAILEEAGIAVPDKDHPGQGSSLDVLGIFGYFGTAETNYGQQKRVSLGHDLSGRGSQHLLLCSIHLVKWR